MIPIGKLEMFWHAIPHTKTFSTLHTILLIPNWHEGGTFIPLYFLDWILSAAEFSFTLSKNFGGEN